MAYRNKITTHINANATGFNKGLKDASRNAGMFSKQMKGIGRSFSTAFAGVFAATAILQFGKNIAKTVMDFEQAMADVKAITGATGAEFDALRESAKALGITTRYQATEVSKLQKEYGKLGFSTQEILNAQEATLNLATAVNADLAQAAAVAGATIRGFGLDASEAARVTDVMAESFTSSALDIERWSESMKYVAPVARAAGISLEETAAMLSQLADAGIHGSMAGTALRNIMSRLIGTGGELAPRIAELAEEGITLASAQDEVGRRSQTALIVLGRGVGTLEDITEAYRNAQGAAKKMADIQLDTIKGQLILLESAWKGLTIQVADSKVEFEGVKSSISGITEKLVELSELVKEGGDWKRGLKKLKLELLSLVPVFGKISKVRLRMMEKRDDKKSKVPDAISGANLPSAFVIDPDAIDKIIPKVGYIAELQQMISAAQTAQKEASEDELPFINQRIALLTQAISDAKELGIITEEQKKAEEERLRILTDMANIQAGYITQVYQMGDGAAKGWSDMVTAASDFRKEIDGYLDQEDEIFIGDEEVDDIIAHYEHILNETEKFKEDMNMMFRDLVINGIGGFAHALGGLASGGGVKNVFQGLLGEVAVFGERFGAMLIAQGIAIEAFKISLEKLSGPVAIAAGVALIAASSLLKNFISNGPGFASGGIVPGTSFSGDNTLARVNSGEMILNKNQQTNLFRQLNSVGGGGQEVIFRIGNDELVGTLNNFSKKQYIMR